MVTPKKKLRILILEDSEDDALLAMHEFKKNNYEIDYERVETAEAMCSALQKQQWDVVLADYTLPRMNALEGLNILHEDGCDIPCIVVSGTIGEDVAVETMKAGAADYIIKGNLKRLVPAVEREIRDAEIRRKHRKAEEKIKRQEKERIFLLHISEICGRVGLDVEGMCREIAATLSGEWHNERKVSVRISLNDRVFEVNCSSDVTWLLSSPIKAGGKIAGTLQMGRADKMPVVTGGAFLEKRQELLDNVAARLGEAVEYRNSQKELEESEARFRHLVEGVGEGIAVLDPDGSILMANNFLVEKTGYSRDELLTMKINDCAGEPISEEDDAAWDKLDFGNYWLFEHVGRRKDGSTFPVEMNITKISQGGRPLMLAAIRDITQRKQVEQERLQHNQDMINALKQAIQAIAVSLEMKDPYTAGHQQRVTKLATDIGREMKLSEESVEALGMAASVHDIGKMYVPSEILSKPARLTAIEFSMVKLHAQAGYDVLKNVEFPWPIAQIVLQHHERMNGSGYPQGLDGADILTEARILAVADVVESMASYRPYRPSLGIEAALEEIKQNRGTLFDKAVVDACLSLFTEKGYQL